MKRLHHAGALHCADINGTFSGADYEHTDVQASPDPATPMARSEALDQSAPHVFHTGTYRSIVVPAFPLHEIAHIRGARA